MISLPESVFRTVWRFGSPCDAFYGFMNLKSNGGIYGYDHPNERSWSYESGEIRFHSASGEITSRLKYYSDSRIFLGTCEGKKWPLCLTPVISTADIPANPTLPSVVINTMPKSGTYFLEAAFVGAGWSATRVHMSAYAQDDYRGLSDDEVHRIPENSRISCPGDFFAASLAPGLLTVGHIDDMNIIAKIRAAGVPLLRCVRNLREVIVSTWRFKLRKVAPIDLQDELWRTAEYPLSFDLFISTYSKRDFEYYRSMARLLLGDKVGLLLRYEELIKGDLPADLYREPMLAPYGEAIRAALLAKVDKDNPTFSGVRSDWRKYWTPFAEIYFEKSGLLELNRELGYE